MPELAAPIPILRSFDEAKAREFYLDFLGFEIVFEHRFGPTAPLYLAVKMGACELHISEHHGDASPGTALRIGIADVHAFSKALCDKAYKYAGPGVKRASYGFDEMTVMDPFGNRLLFCTPVP